MSSAHCCGAGVPVGQAPQDRLGVRGWCDVVDSAELGTVTKATLAIVATETRPISAMALRLRLRVFFSVGMPSKYEDATWLGILCTAENLVELAGMPPRG